MNDLTSTNQISDEQFMELFAQLDEREYQLLLLGIKYMVTYSVTATGEMLASALAEYNKGARITAKELLGIVEQTRRPSMKENVDGVTGWFAEDTGEGQYGKH